MNCKGLTGYTWILFLGFVSCDKSSIPENIIRQNRLASNLAIALHDTAALSSFWTDDIMVLTSRNFQTLGKLEYAVALDKEFKTKKDVIYIRSTDKVEVFTTWGMASELGKWVGRWDEGDEKIEISGSYYAKWQNVGGEWLIRAEV
ncbi:MAG: hypothetical protein C0490_01640, partial [Marivirga sp.]|nr:hypothetical protein [Marivirga sp.]